VKRTQLAQKQGQGQRTEEINKTETQRLKRLRQFRCFHSEITDNSDLRRSDALTGEAAKGDSIRNVGNRLESSKKDSIHRLDMVESVYLFIYLYMYGSMDKDRGREGRTDITKYMKIKVGGQV
jgi:hypothetical protein